MDILDVTKEEYKKLVVNPFSRFDTVDFVELNKHKVNEVRYFIFNNGKNRFGLVGGIKDGILKCPFSATFGIFSEITRDNKIEYYYNAIKSLVNWAKTNSILNINIATPALCYNLSHITKFQNALINNNFNLKHFDLNYEYYLDDFNEHYLEKIQRNARKNYNTSLKHNLKFIYTDDIYTVYSIIKKNRESRGFPLWMSLDDVKNTSKIIKTDYFLITTQENKPIASAVVHHLTNNILRVVYWGNLTDAEEYRPINFLSHNLLNYYARTNYKVIDIGTSTVNGFANFGLCDFKQSIGCKASPKLSFELNLSNEKE